MRQSSFLVVRYYIDSGSLSFTFFLPRWQGNRTGENRREFLRFLDDHYPLAAPSTSLRYAQGERHIPARAERSCDSSGVGAHREWRGITWNPY
ncbi:MAG: hypothetical protein AB7P69_04330 [Candidatus Binatia bacterium]